MFIVTCQFSPGEFERISFGDDYRYATDMAVLETPPGYKLPSRRVGALFDCLRSYKWVDVLTLDSKQIENLRNLEAFGSGQIKTLIFSNPIDPSAIDRLIKAGFNVKIGDPCAVSSALASQCDDSDAEETLPEPKPVTPIQPASPDLSASKSAESNDEALSENEHSDPSEETEKALSSSAAENETEEALSSSAAEQDSAVQNCLEELASLESDHSEDERYQTASTLLSSVTDEENAPSQENIEALHVHGQALQRSSTFKALGIALAALAVILAATAVTIATAGLAAPLSAVVIGTAAVAASSAVGSGCCFFASRHTNSADSTDSNDVFLAPRK